MKVNIDYSNCLRFVDEKEIHILAQNSVIQLRSLTSGDGKGSDYLGWLNLGEEAINNIPAIKATARRLRDSANITVVIGIGGSYLGSKAIIESQSRHFYEKSKKHEIIYAGQNISEDYLTELVEYLSDKKFNIIIISKSGTTTEPAIAFRILRNLLEESEGKKIAATRIVAITDNKKGALRALSTSEGYETFVIPDDVGGRYSVLTPVGLLPLAVAGLDIIEFVQGARDMAVRTRDNEDHLSNPALIYAATRNLLYNRGKIIEILVNFDPKLHYIGEWWKQLFGESEGKDGKGIFPASADLTTDLHSLGQYIQDGQRVLFETVLSLENNHGTLELPVNEVDLDGLNYIAGKRLFEVNKKAEEGTIMAHVDGGVPVIKITIPALNENCMGQLIYLMEISCAVSGYILGVNPFDQPGVEAYKKNMFALLGK